jgi:hypothetical protein
VRNVCQLFLGAIALFVGLTHCVGGSSVADVEDAGTTRAAHAMAAANAHSTAA